MRPADVRSLRALATQAQRRLAAVLPPGHVAPVAASVRRAVEAAALHGTSRGLGVLVNRSVAKVLLLPDPVTPGWSLSAPSPLERLAGRIRPEVAQTLPQLAASAGALLERYLFSRQAEALVLLAAVEREHPEDVAPGLDRCWRLARSAPPRMRLGKRGSASLRPPRTTYRSMTRGRPGGGGDPPGRHVALVGDGDLAARSSPVARGEGGGVALVMLS